MERRTFMALVSGGLVVAPLPAEAQPRKIPRLCFLTFDPGTPQSTRFTPFFRGLRDLCSSIAEVRAACSLVRCAPVSDSGAAR